MQRPSVLVGARQSQITKQRSTGFGNNRAGRWKPWGIGRGRRRVTQKALGRFKGEKRTLSSGEIWGGEPRVFLRRTKRPTGVEVRLVVVSPELWPSHKVSGSEFG
jgi:hypothetical protein